MKKIIAIAALISAGFAANAQTPASTSASQTVNLSLTDAIELTFTGSGTCYRCCCYYVFQQCERLR